MFSVQGNNSCISLIVGKEAHVVQRRGLPPGFGDFHAKGTVVTFIKLKDDPETADAFGVCCRSRVTNSLALQLLQNPSKVVKTVDVGEMEPRMSQQVLK